MSRSHPPLWYGTKSQMSLSKQALFMTKTRTRRYGKGWQTQTLMKKVARRSLGQRKILYIRQFFVSHRIYISCLGSSFVSLSRAVHSSVRLGRRLRGKLTASGKHLSCRCSCWADLCILFIASFRAFLDLSSPAKWLTDASGHN